MLLADPNPRLVSRRLAGPAVDRQQRLILVLVSFFLFFFHLKEQGVTVLKAEALYTVTKISLFILFIYESGECDKKNLQKI